MSEVASTPELRQQRRWATSVAADADESDDAARVERATPSEDVATIATWQPSRPRALLQGVEGREERLRRMLGSARPPAFTTHRGRAVIARDDCGAPICGCRMTITSGS